MKLNSLLKLSTVLILGGSSLGCQAELSEYNSSGAASAHIIAGGEVSAEDPLAARVVGFVDEDGESYCTGILLKKNIVLTAAHCIFMHENISIFFGVNHRRAQKILLEDVIYMDQFMKTSAVVEGEEAPLWDLALIKLAEEAPKGFVASDILESSRGYKKDLTMLAMGYGLNQSESVPAGAGLLRRGKVQFDKIENSLEFSTQPQNTLSACNGDSGGPLFVKENQQWKVAGILSRGRHETNCLEGNIYTDLASAVVKKWMKESLAVLGSP